MIALLCSVQSEAEHLLGSIVRTGSLTLGSKLLTTGTLAGHNIVLCVGGMGKVNAAHASTLMLTRFNPQALVVFGIGGAYPASGARIGDIALAKEEIAGDEGVLTQEGFRDTGYIGIPLVQTRESAIYSTFPASEPLLDRSLRALTSLRTSGRNALHTGSFVTLSACTGTLARSRELEERYHGLCENMEGAAVAQVATLHGVPWLEVRGISNIVEDRDVKTWDTPRAAEAAQRAVLRIAEEWQG